MDVRTGRHCVSALHLHLVFVTRYRRGALTDPVLQTCEAAMRKVCGDFGADLREFNGEEDHVHLLVSVPPTVQPAKLINSLKGVSSRMMRSAHGPHLKKYLWGNHLWSRSYFVGSCGGAPLAILAEYIQNQKRPVEAGASKASNPRPEGRGTPAS